MSLKRHLFLLVVEEKFRELFGLDIESLPTLRILLKNPDFFWLRPEFIIPTIFLGYEKFTCFSFFLTCSMQVFFLEKGTQLQNIYSIYLPSLSFFKTEIFIMIHISMAQK